jgi:hypothetical protein
MVDEMDYITQEGFATLRYLSVCSEAAVAETIDRLRRQKRLSCTVRTLNLLLSDPQHRSDALFVLRRMGLEFAG